LTSQLANCFKFYIIAYENMSRLNLLQKAERIYGAALAEVEPKNLIKKNVSVRNDKLRVEDRIFDLSSFKGIFLVSIGKAAPFMAEGLCGILGKRLKEGIALFVPGAEQKLEKIICLPASHPLPDEKSVAAAKRILELATKAGPRDLIFFLISGGGSAQVCLPAEGVSLAEKRNVTEMLLKAGASINELNTVRKHLSRIKGGRLAQAAFPATVINLIVSDVVGNDLENIASGLTCWDSSTYAEAFRVLKKYGLWDLAPGSVRKVISKGMEGKISETIKRGAPVFRRVYHFIIGDNLLALNAAQKEARRLGFKTSILTSADRGEARDMARSYVSLLQNLPRPKKTQRPLCLLSSGELTVTVRGRGKGGRNQEFVLAALQEMKRCISGFSDWLVLSFGSDGIDGPTDAAGAWADRSILKKAKELGLDPQKYLDDNDSYNFFKKAGGLVITGPTHTNVMDIRIFLIS
jgi:glycerate-2-kinase